LSDLPGRFYDVAPDGKTVVAAWDPRREEGTRSVHAMFLVNFFDELQRRIPENK
jgi:hypothetical protein